MNTSLSRMAPEDILGCLSGLRPLSSIGGIRCNETNNGYGTPVALRGSHRLFATLVSEFTTQ
jgi:hypothetical protein